MRLRFESSTSLPGPFETQLTTDSAGLALFNLLPATYTIQMETIGFDDYSLKNVVVKVGETTAVQANLDAVDELPFVRLPEMQIYDFMQACKQAEFWKVQLKKYSFENDREWTTLWSEFKLPTPVIDFRKWRVLAWMRRSGQSQPPFRISRVTFNPKQKVLHARFDRRENFGDARLQVLTCVAEFVLIPTSAESAGVPVIIGPRVRY